MDGYILLGDYCLSNPEPDACVTRIRNLPNAHVIRGNEERYFETLMHQDQRTWTDGQMEISYWCYRRHHRTIVSAAFAQSFAPSVQL